MKPHIVMAAAFLLLGAVVNVAVAWGCGICVDPLARGETEFAILTTAQHNWEVRRIERPGLTVCLIS